MSVTVSTPVDKLLEEANLPSIKSAIRAFCNDCDRHGLFKTMLWLNELNKSIICDTPKESILKIPYDNEDYELLIYAEVLFKVKQYNRCAYHLKSVKSDRGIFLHCYSLFKNLELNKPIDFSDMSSMTKDEYIGWLKRLDTRLETQLLNSNYGFLYYLRGLICIKLGNKDVARDLFQLAINALPLLWEAWDELVKLTNDKIQLMKLDLPCHWIEDFFLVKVYIKFNSYGEALKILSELSEKGFEKAPFVVTNMAVAYHGLSDLDKSLCCFRAMRKKDRFIMNYMDVYSNILYVLGNKKELTKLARDVFDTNKYAIETCVALGNECSLKGNHIQSSKHFYRAIKLNPTNISSLILRGHEFMELKSANNAIMSYREAAALNPKDHRAWYGMGVAQELLSLPCNSLYYYQKAHMCKPSESRVLTALGEVYERFNNTANAIRCYTRARNTGDVESFAITRLARLYAGLKAEDEAAEAYTKMLEELNQNTFAKEHAEAYTYLALYHFERQHYPESFRYSRLCLNYDEAKSVGRKLLKEIVSIDYACSKIKESGLEIYPREMFLNKDLDNSSPLVEGSEHSSPLFDNSSRSPADDNSMPLEDYDNASLLLKDNSNPALKCVDS